MRPCPAPWTRIFPEASTVPKASPEFVARAIFDGVEKEEEDIFPDPMSESIAESWSSGAVKGLERQFAALVNAEPVNAQAKGGRCNFGTAGKSLRLVRRGNPGRVTKWLGNMTVGQAIFDSQRHKLELKPPTTS
jgi:hypothetical protein